MLKHEVEIGGVYRVRWHDGSFVDVKIVGIQRVNIRARRNGAPVVGSKARFSAINLATGRRVVIKSAAKLRERVG